MLVLADYEALNQHNLGFHLFRVDLHLALGCPAVLLEPCAEIVALPLAVPLPFTPVFLFLVKVQFVRFIIVFAAVVSFHFANLGSAFQVLMFP